MADDGDIQPGTPRYRCNILPLALETGVHFLYIDGWSSTSFLSMSATYQGPDTGNSPVPIRSTRNPFAFSNPVSRYSECNFSSFINDDKNFTICGFKASNDVNLWSVEDVFVYYTQVFCFEIS